ncbi:hypothetical protein ACH4KU_19105 [Streptomyces althioticus]|uniref:hypothetical protein n=1 Tax=Streptomyces althioticus TaxID=83380 RepID=UPI00379A1CF1
MIDIEDRMTLDERPAADCILAQRMRSSDTLCPAPWKITRDAVVNRGGEVALPGGGTARTRDTDRPTP